VEILAHRICSPICLIDSVTQSAAVMWLQSQFANPSAQPGNFRTQLARFLLLYWQRSTWHTAR